MSGALDTSPDAPAASPDGAGAGGGGGGSPDFDGTVRRWLATWRPWAATPLLFRVDRAQRLPSAARPEPEPPAEHHPHRHGIVAFSDPGFGKARGMFSRCELLFFDEDYAGEPFAQRPICPQTSLSRGEAGREDEWVLRFGRDASSAVCSVRFRSRAAAAVFEREVRVRQRLAQECKEVLALSARHVRARGRRLRAGACTQRLLGCKQPAEKTDEESPKTDEASPKAAPVSLPAVELNGRVRTSFYRGAELLKSMDADAVAATGVVFLAQLPSEEAGVKWAMMLFEGDLPPRGPPRWTSILGPSTLCGKEEPNTLHLVLGAGLGGVSLRFRDWLVSDEFHRDLQMRVLLSRASARHLAREKPVRRRQRQPPMRRGGLLGALLDAARGVRQGARCPSMLQV